MWKAILVALATASPGIWEPQARVAQELAILRMGLEAYHVDHQGRYPEAANLEGLVRLLAWEGEVPSTFVMSVPAEEFHCTARGYRLRVRMDEGQLAIASRPFEEPFVNWLRVGW